jgi:hypothetical protein
MRFAQCAIAIFVAIFGILGGLCVDPFWFPLRRRFRD